MVSLIERAAQLISNRLFDPGHALFLPTLVGRSELALPPVTKLELADHLPRGCPDGYTEGPALLSLDDQVLHGLGSLRKEGELSLFPLRPGYRVVVRATFAGPRVPAEPGVDFNVRGSPIAVGPSSLAGIADFPGLRLAGNFTCYQRCTTGGMIEPSGRFLATVNPVNLEVSFRLFFPTERGKKPYVEMEAIRADPVTEKQMTLTLLYPDGRLPTYASRALDRNDTVAVNYYEAMRMILFPPKGIPAPRARLATLFNTELERLLTGVVPVVGTHLDSFLATTF